MRGVPGVIVVIDNYDSFTFNLVQYMKMAGADVRVFRNDEITVEQVKALNPHGIVLSPGPCTPLEAGISVHVVQQLYTSIPMLGVCLGHQSIGQAFGAQIVRAKTLMHGKTSIIEHNGESELFTRIPARYTAARYHSLVVEPNSLPQELRVIATTDDGVIMALSHATYPVFGVQFHPEAVLTEYGHELIENFLLIADEWAKHQQTDSSSTTGRKTSVSEEVQV